MIGFRHALEIQGDRFRRTVVGEAPEGLFFERDDLLKDSPPSYEIRGDHVAVLIGGRYNVMRRMRMSAVEVPGWARPGGLQPTSGEAGQSEVKEDSMALGRKAGPLSKAEQIGKAKPAEPVSKKPAPVKKAAAPKPAKREPKKKDQKAGGPWELIARKAGGTPEVIGRYAHRPGAYIAGQRLGVKKPSSREWCIGTDGREYLIRGTAAA